MAVSSTVSPSAHHLECAAAGMDGFLTKPLGRAALPQLQQRAREYERAAAQLAAGAWQSIRDAHVVTGRC